MKEKFFLGKERKAYRVRYLLMVAMLVMACVGGPVLAKNNKNLDIDTNKDYKYKLGDIQSGFYNATTDQIYVSYTKTESAQNDSYVILICKQNMVWCSDTSGFSGISVLLRGSDIGIGDIENCSVAIVELKKWRNKK